jgi:hypothetical protein
MFLSLLTKLQMFYVWAFCHTTDINTIVHYANGFDNVESYR